MNKNETLARCRMLWAMIVKNNRVNVNTVFPHLHFRNHCPLCEYCNGLQNRPNCNECIDWGKYPEYLSVGCASSASPYPDDPKGVLAVIDHAITLYDRTGDWK